MFKKIREQKGFTLVEMLISMAIFMTFTGILISSYTGIIRSQRDANSYREMYVQGRQVMETLVQELRDGMVDYGTINTTSGSKNMENGEIYLISRDGATKTHVTYKDSTVKLHKSRLALGNQPATGANYTLDIDTISLNDENSVKVTKFRVYYSPKIDPYDPKSVDYGTSQFQPRVTVYAEFTKDLGPNREPYVMDLQTTVSSRVYNQVYPTNYLYTNIK